MLFSKALSATAVLYAAATVLTGTAVYKQLCDADIATSSDAAVTLR
jgi:hypothetical protein